VLVQFNPTTLAYSVQNTLEKKGRDANAKQFVAQTTAKLDFDLVFDSTHDGGDVRRETDRIKQFLNPGDPKTNADQAPPLVGFRWGTFLFKGIVESFKETLDFFSAAGVPLRSSLKIVLASQDPKDVFAPQNFGSADAAAAAGANVTLATVPSRGTTAMGGQNGNTGPGRALAAANGFESLRNPGAGLAAVASGGVQLKAAAAFSAGASGGIGFGAGAGLGGGFGASVGAGLGASAGGSFGASAGAGFSASAGAGLGTSASGGFSASAGAGFSATAGGGFAGAGFSSSGSGSSSLQAFAGLGPSKTPTVARVDMGMSQAPAVTATASGNFALGGKVVGSGSAGLRADMGATARIRFD